MQLQHFHLRSRAVRGDVDQELAAVLPALGTPEVIDVGCDQQVVLALRRGQRQPGLQLRRHWRQGEVGIVWKQRRAEGQGHAVAPALFAL
jgi:hypothetical protein